MMGEAYCTVNQYKHMLLKAENELSTLVTKTVAFGEQRPYVFAT